MKKLIAILMLTASPAFAQTPATYTFTITPTEADVISDGLQTQPFGKVFPLINKLREQIIAQQPKQADPPKPEVSRSSSPAVDYPDPPK